MIWITEGEQVIISSHSILIMALTYNSKVTAIGQVQFMFVFQVESGTWTDPEINQGVAGYSF